MINFDEALHIVLGSAFETGTEIIPFTGSTGRVLAEDIFSDMDMPPFNRAAVDGYACRRQDIENEMVIVGLIAAGREPIQVGVRQCAKIMTGAIVPDGCDIVFMVEDAEELPEGRVRFRGNSLKTNISYQGEDVMTGELIIGKGKIIKPQDIAILASTGHIDVQVKKMPETAIISTGDELVEPSQKPLRSQIRNSNSWQLLSQVERAGGNPHYYGIAPDTGDSAFDIISKAIGSNDIVILTGGVSMGDFDFVPSFLKRAGVEIMFDRVNVQPGKPTTFGVHPKCLVFGLPGNPVSSFIQFETLVRPLIQRMMASEWRSASLRLPMGVRYERNSATRMGWIPVNIDANGEAIPVDYHGSAHIAALSYSDGIFSMMPGVRSVEKGETVSVRYI